MGVETATYISGLNATNPVVGDAKTEGDDHLRLIKSTLLATFPEITGAVNATHTQIGDTAAFLQAGTGAVERSGRDKMRDSVSVIDFGAVGDGTADDSSAFLNAIATKRRVFVPAGTYKITQKLVINEGGLIGDTWGTGGSASRSRLIFYNLTSTTAGAIEQDWATYQNSSVHLENLEIIASSWNGVTGCLGYGLNITGRVIARNVWVGGFAKTGVFLHNTASDGQAPYYSLLENLHSEYNGGHGILVGPGANACTFINPVCRWNGTPSYLTAPSVAGNFDGFLVKFDGDGNPGAAFFSAVPQQVSVIGGDCSYNSRYGWNFDSVYDTAAFPGYAEGNLQSAPGQARVGPSCYHSLIAFQAISGRDSGINCSGPASGADFGGTRIFAGGRDLGAADSNTDTSRSNLANARRISYFGADGTYANATYIATDSSGNATLTAAGSAKWSFVNTKSISGSGTAAQNLRGQVTLSSGTASVSFGTAEPDANYHIALGGNAAESFYWSAKATSGFTISSSNASSTAIVNWILIR